MSMKKKKEKKEREKERKQKELDEGRAFSEQEGVTSTGTSCKAEGISDDIQVQDGTKSGTWKISRRISSNLESHSPWVDPEDVGKGSLGPPPPVFTLSLPLTRHSALSPPRDPAHRTHPRLGTPRPAQRATGRSDSCVT